MQSIVKDLLEELYSLEPNLRKQEKQLTKIVSLMVQNIPKSEMNSEFKKELKKEILMKIHSQKKNSYYTLYLPILSGLSLCGIIILAGINFIQPLVIGGKSISFAPHIEHTEDGAFGHTIKTNPTGGSHEYGGGERVPMMAMNKMAGDRMIAYNPVTYVYSYTGKLTIPTGKLTVYKRNSVGFDAADTSGFIRNLHIDGLNLSALKNAGLSNVGISEDREFGYNIGIDFIQGTVNFNQNYIKWPQGGCNPNQDCKEPRKLTEQDIPTDEDMVRLSDNFITEYNIDKKLYGTPVVNSEWRTDYMRQKESGGDVYIPEMYTVTYPIKIDNQYVYEEYGGYKGLIFTFDIRSKKISSVTGLEKYNLIASEYPTSSEAKIQKMITSGGRNISENTGSGEVKTITLSTPTLGYVRIYGEWKDNMSSDFLVPAYIFKVENKPTDGYVPDTITIPLVDGFTENNTAPSGRPIEPIMMQ